MKTYVTVGKRIRRFHRMFVPMAAVLAAFAFRADAQSRSEVDVSLILGIDCSYSVDAAEYNLQIAGIAQALVSLPVLDAIADGPLGVVSITVVQWSGSDSQINIVPWTLVRGPADAVRLAGQILAAPRRALVSATSTSAFIDHARELLITSPYQGLRAVIDVASDGTSNNGARVEEARNRALRDGVVVNGLVIIHEIPWLAHYFRNRVTGGPGSFVMEANSYADFGAAMQLKLEREIRGSGIS